MPHTLIIDGLQVTEVSDQAKAAIEKLQGQFKDAEARAKAAETKVGELTATVSTKDGEIAALNKKLEDEKVTPAQLEKMANDRATLIGQAKAIHAEVVTDGKSASEIKKAVVEAKLGDAAKGLDDAAISGAFTVLAKDVKPVGEVIASGTVNAGDAQAEYDKAIANRNTQLRDAWKGEPAKAA